MSRAVLAVARDMGAFAAVATGTLLRLIEQGDSVLLAEVAPDSASSAGERNPQREAFARTLGAAWLGSVRFKELEDGHLVRDPVMDVIRQARPDVVLVSAPAEGEQLRLTELVFNAAYCSTIPNYLSPTGLEAVPVRAPILEVDCPSRPDYQPDMYVDITAQWQHKLELLDMAGAAENGLRELAEITSRARGIQVQIEFAEAFRIEKVWGRIRPYRELP